MPDIAKLAWPLRVVGGRPVTVEQGSPEEIEQCVASILRFPLGSRLELPDFGLRQLEFAEFTADELLELVREWEPRATVEITVGAVQDLQRDVDVEVSG